MADKKKIIVFYGGESATAAREELINWLRSRFVDVDARVVAEDSPHSAGAVDDRVSQAIEWADGAIALFTPDPRTNNSAPLNVADEVGRWREKKGKDTLCLVLQEGVQLHSNLSGLVYVTFTSRIKEAYELIRRFLHDLEPAAATTAAPANAEANFIVDGSGNGIWLGDRRFDFSDISQSGALITVSFSGLTGAEEAHLRRLENAPGRLEVSYGNTATSVDLQQCAFTHGAKGAGAELSLRDTRDPYGGSIMEVTVGNVGPDEIARRRASRILFNTPAADPDTHGLEMFIRGMGDRSKHVTESPIEAVLASLPRNDRRTWETLRLVLILYLRLGECVETVEHLTLTVRASKLVRIQFRGTRRHVYTNKATPVIEFDRPYEVP